MKEKVEFDYPKTKDDAVRKACICYQQMKQKNEGFRRRTIKKGRNLIPSKHPKFSNNKNLQKKSLHKFLASNQPKAIYSKN